MNYPHLSIIIPTYNRPWILRRVVQGLKDNLHYSGPLHFWIGADGDLSVGKMLAGQHDINVIPGPNRGLGANLNRLITSTPDDYLFQLDDDHLLLKPLDLDRHVIKLRDDPMAGWIRLMGIGYHAYKARLEETYWRISWKSPENYIPSNRPHLKHRRFHDYFGLYPEDVSLAETEDGFCEQCKAKKGGPSVLVPLDVLTESGWDHIGHSWQFEGK